MYYFISVVNIAGLLLFYVLYHVKHVNKCALNKDFFDYSVCNMQNEIFKKYSFVISQHHELFSTWNYFNVC